MNMLTVYSLGALLRKPNLVAKFRLWGGAKKFTYRFASTDSLTYSNR